MFWIENLQAINHIGKAIAFMEKRKISFSILEEYELAQLPNVEPGVLSV